MDSEREIGDRNPSCDESLSVTTDIQGLVQRVPAHPGAPTRFGSNRILGYDDVQVYNISKEMEQSSNEKRRKFKFFCG